MTILSAERKAIEIADEFARIRFGDNAHATAWLVNRIKAALVEAEEAGFKKAMRKRF